MTFQVMHSQERASMQRSKGAAGDRSDHQGTCQPRRHRPQPPSMSAQGIFGLIEHLLDHQPRQCFHVTP